ncbi:hypothetical protein ABZ614_41070 [Streptomyces sp. NPDC013178]
MVLWDDVFKRVAADYPDVETESVLVDAMSAKFVLHPEDLSVVVASDLNADHGGRDQGPDRRARRLTV